LGFLVANETSALTIRTLRGKIKELKVKRCRLIFFIKNDTIYVIDLFEKKSAKTPHHILARAEKIYSQLV
jgi:phage-related protein